MKLFKKALIASAVVSAFGAQAVTISSDKLQISKQGIEIGNDAIVAATDTGDFVLDFVVDKLTPSASTITLTFSEGIDLSGMDVTSSDVNNVVGTGTGVVAEAGNGTFFSYGTGSFTFDRFEVDTDEDEHVIQFEVNLGNPLTASSAFRLTLADIDTTNGINFTSDDDAEVCYESKDAGGVLIEAECFQITELKDQFAFDVATEWDAKIERVDQLEFSRLQDSGTTNADTLKFTLMNDESLLAAVTGVDANVSIADGDFGDYANAAMSTANFGANVIASGAAINADADEITFVVTNAELALEGANGSSAVSGELTFTANGTDMIPVTGALMATATFTDGTEEFDLTDAAGEWMLDATVINVPYLPLLFADTSASVHVSNDGNDAANIMATIITYGSLDGDDQTRSESYDFGDVPANTMVKLSQVVLADAFGITDATKVSITFNIDGYAQDISAYATVTSATGRTEVSNSQAKVDGKGL